jgi:hypothetical protein
VAAVPVELVTRDNLDRFAEFKRKPVGSRQ